MAEGHEGFYVMKRTDKEKKVRARPSPDPEGAELPSDGHNQVTATAEEHEVIHVKKKKKKEGKAREGPDPDFEGAVVPSNGHNQGILTAAEGMPMAKEHEVIHGTKKKKKKEAKARAGPDPDLPGAVVPSNGHNQGTVTAVEGMPMAEEHEVILAKTKKKKKKGKKRSRPGHELEGAEVFSNGHTEIAKENKDSGKNRKKKLDVETILENREPEVNIEAQNPTKKKRKVSSQVPELAAEAETQNNKVTSQVPESAGEAQIQTKKKKRVTFQVPEEAGEARSHTKKKKKVTSQESKGAAEKEVSREDAEREDGVSGISNDSWRSDRLRQDLVYGQYTAEEDEALKTAIFSFIRMKGWEQEDGLQKVLNSWKYSEARGCWSTILGGCSVPTSQILLERHRIWLYGSAASNKGTCLPKRAIKRLNSRAHRLLSPGVHLGKWSAEEVESLKNLHKEHGNNWKKISGVLGRDAGVCKDKWRMLKGHRKGSWSQEELEKLCSLAFKCLHVKRQLTESASESGNHKVLRDDINWEFIAEQIEGRSYVECMKTWYSRMASSMVSSGDWSNSDDQLLLERLMKEFPLSEELVDWNSLLEHRSGEICKKRWEQMERTLGRGAQQHRHFLDKLEVLVKRYAPYLLEEEYDRQFAKELQNAEAMQDELNEEAS